MVSSTRHGVRAKCGAETDAIDDLATMLAKSTGCLAKEFATRPSKCSLFGVVSRGGVGVQAYRGKGLGCGIDSIADPVACYACVLDGIWHVMGSALIQLAGYLCGSVHSGYLRYSSIERRFRDGPHGGCCFANAFEERRVLGVVVSTGNRPLGSPLHKLVAKRVEPTCVVAG